MRISRFLRRFLGGYLVLHLLMAALFVAVFSWATRSQMTENARTEMHSLARLLRAHIQELPEQLDDATLVDYLLRIGAETQYRYTLIDESGNVLGDSQSGARDIGPHGNRPEVVQAKTQPFGFSIRFSRTLQQEMMYLAIPFYDRQTPNQRNGIIRVSASLSVINQSIKRQQTFIWSFAVTLGLLTGTLMTLISSRMMHPLSRFSDAARRIGSGQFQEPVPLQLGRSDEWSELSEAFSQMQSELADRESQLLENNQRVQAVLSSMIEGVISTAPDGRVLMANQAAGQMLSLDRSELIDRKLLDVIRFPEFGRAIERAKTNRSLTESEFEVTDEPRRILKARVSPLSLDPQLGLAIVLHDITDIRALENMRRDFVANVSHELKTPLSSIKAYAETLQMGAIHDADKSVEFVGQIEAQAEVLNLQIQDLIELARIESGKATLDIVDVNFNLACQNAIQRFQTQSDQRSVTLTFEAPEQPVVGMANKEGINTIVNNLLSNAIHYTPAGGQVTLRARNEGDVAILEVSDTGIGIAPEQQKRVFERFYRVDKARSRDMGGTGLGLSIVKHLTQSFRGTIHLTSQIGKGSTFQVRIPRN